MSEGVGQSDHRPLSDKERAALLGLAQTLQAMRTAFLGLTKLGWTPPHDLETFDDGCEVIRALATDTHSLVREYNR